MRPKEIAAMKEFQLDTPSKPLSAQQRNAIYWRAWNAAEKAQPRLNRFAITCRVVGRVKKIADLTDDELAKLVRAFGKIAKRSDAVAKVAPPADAPTDARAAKKESRPSRKRIERALAVGSNGSAPPPQIEATTQAAFAQENPRVDAETRYTAAQLAPAIGVSVTRIRQRIGATGAITDNPTVVKTWALSDLPPDWKGALAKRRRAAGYGSDAEWIASRKAWQPSIPFSELSEELKAMAGQRRDILAPLLRRSGDGETSLIVRAASQIYRDRTLPIPNERTLRRWIEMVIERDDGRCDFDRPELYLVGRLTRRSSRIAQGKFDGCSITSWSEACHLYSTLIGNGEAEAVARQAVLRLVRRSLFAKDMLADSARKAFTRKIAQWTCDGELKDRRSESGRRAKFEFNAKEINALRDYHLRKDSLPLAIEDFIKKPECRPETREKIQAEMDRAARERRLPQWPMSVRRAAYVSNDMRAKFRGRKHAQQFEIVERRGLHWIDENGLLIPIIGNSMFESDDMSCNKPFCYSDPGTSAIQVGRQTLCSMNVYSAAWLGVSPVGRERDAYRLEDIADHLLDVVLEHGLPLMWRFERGPWENQVVDGIKLPPEMRPPDWNEKTRWGSLDRIFRVIHVFNSRAKGLIESSFNLLQALIDHNPDTDGVTIGRKRGEFERATKLYHAATDSKCSAEKRESAAAHFWKMGAAADGIAAAMDRFNNRPKIRRALGRQAVVPNDLQCTAVKRECPPAEMWRFSPTKKTATVRGGAIETTVPHYPFPFRFRVNGVTELHLEYGYAVLIAFHPGRPEDGCHVFNAERGVRNRKGLRFGEFMFVSPMAEDTAQLNLSADEKEFLARKNSNAAVRSEFRAIVATGRRGRRVSTARDGFGNSTTLRSPDCDAGARPSLNNHDAGSKRGGDIISTAQQRHEDEEEYQRNLAKSERLEKQLLESGEITIHPSCRPRE
jgi:hypothetical protein